MSRLHATSCLALAALLFAGCQRIERFYPRATGTASPVPIHHPDGELDIRDLPTLAAAQSQVSSAASIVQAAKVAESDDGHAVPETCPLEPFFPTADSQVNAPAPGVEREEAAESEDKDTAHGTCSLEPVGAVSISKWSPSAAVATCAIPSSQVN